MDLNDVFGGSSLKAADLKGHEPVVRITRVEMKKFDNGNKLVIAFAGKEKVLICNKTNANRIAHYYGSNTDNWIGRDIQLYTDLVDFQGKPTEAIRVRAPKSQQTERVPDPPPQRRIGGMSDNALDDEIPF